MICEIYTCNSQFLKEFCLFSVPCTRALQQVRLSNDVNHLLPQTVDLLAEEKESISITTHESLQLTELSQAVKLEEPSHDGEPSRQHVKLHILPNGQVFFN